MRPMAGATGIGRHPGFIIFDSPREADLGPSIYRSFLRFLSVAPATSSLEPAVQFIVTTTTPPPKALRDSPPVILTLRRDGEGSPESGLLFGSTLKDRVHVEEHKSVDLFAGRDS